MDANDDLGETPLHEAAVEGHADIVTVGNTNHAQVLLTSWSQILLDAGADVDAIDDIGETPLHDAAEYGHLDVVQVRRTSLFYSAAQLVIGSGRSWCFQNG